MHLIYGDCRCNARAASQLYRQRYPKRIASLIIEYLSMCIAYSSLRAGFRTKCMVKPKYFSTCNCDKHRSIQNCSSQNTKKKVIFTHIMFNGCKLCYPGIMNLELNFKNQEEPLFLQKVLWSDESTFKKDGYMNLHNLHEWHVENPNLMRQDRSQYRFKINMYVLNAEIYLNFLQNQLPNLLEDMPLSIFRDMWFQQDGCPAHYSRSMDRGRSGVISWPARSPDLNPLDFFYWVSQGKSLPKTGRKHKSTKRELQRQSNFLTTDELRE
uniref:SFRICE_035028 n=1 Tax=Spodoptera frugiperda TaxID=7108 RepID=A0A2H1VCG6_SPOFR